MYIYIYTYTPNMLPGQYFHNVCYFPSSPEQSDWSIDEIPLGHDFTAQLFRAHYLFTNRGPNFIFLDLNFNVSVFSRIFIIRPIILHRGGRGSGRRPSDKYKLPCAHTFVDKVCFTTCYWICYWIAAVLLSAGLLSCYSACSLQRWPIALLSALHCCRVMSASWHKSNKVKAPHEVTGPRYV